MRAKKYPGFLILFLITTAVFGQNISVDGALEWDTMQIGALVTLDLASAGIKLPAGRTRGEAVIASEYLRLIRPRILDIQVDSSSTLADLIDRGELSLAQAEDFARSARAAPPFVSPNLLNLSASYTISLENISAALIRHSRPSEIRRTLAPVPAPDYSGIIIIADFPLPVHGMHSNAAAVPCLFPKIWDTEMNLIYERNMLAAGAKTMARYASAGGIFAGSPSGLTPEIISLVGEKPLRIMARGLFGSPPADPVIDTQDALVIISSEENRRLLREGRVLIILDDSALKKSLR